MRSRVLFVAAAIVFAAAAAHAQPFTEGFDDITTLPAAGWAQRNNSSPLGPTGWFQGDPSAFASHQGAPDAYIAADVDSVDKFGTISNWLMTPAVVLVNGATLSFYTRTPAASPFPDRLEVRMSTNGSSVDVGTTSTSVGDFTTLLLSINPGLVQGGYPESWTQFTVTVIGAPAPILGRFAFRYFVTDGGPLGKNSNYIGIDTVTYHGAYVRGDFDNDRKPDILWRHDVSGQNVVWFMNGTVMAGGTFLTPPAFEDVNWKMVGTHDFNADNRTDILWRHEVSGQNVVWYMTGTVMTGGTFLTPAALVDGNWKMAGTGDFNRDNRPDIAWHHQASGQVVIWYMDGSVMTSGTFTTPSAFPDTNWRIVGVADFNSDHKPDFLWHHQLSGQLAIWYMNDSVMTGGTATTPDRLPDTNFRPSAAGDYNGDHKTDIVWRNAVTGENLIWLMNGAVQMSSNPIPTLVDANWKIVGPR